MKNRTKRVTAIIVSAAVMILLSITALASATKPYTTYYTTIYPGATVDQGYSYISKCSCNPVDNYLYAGVRVQYYNGNNYIWDPASSLNYYYSEGYDVSYRDASCSHININYADGYFKARCYASGGSLYVYHDYATP